MIEYVHAFIHCKIDDIFQGEIDTSYKNLCLNGKMKEDHTHLQTKGLVHSMHVPTVFKPKWMRIVLIWVHDHFIWLDGLVKIKKYVLHIVTRFLISDRPRAYKKTAKNNLCELTKSKWDERGLKLSIVDYLELRFVSNIISYQIFQSFRVDSVPCGAIDIAYKIVKKDMKIDLCEIFMKQLDDNMNTIRKEKSTTLKFSPLLVCIFFYFHNFFPTIGKITCKEDKPIFY